LDILGGIIFAFCAGSEYCKRGDVDSCGAEVQGFGSERGGADSREWVEYGFLCVEIGDEVLDDLGGVCFLVVKPAVDWEVLGSFKCKIG